MESDHSNYTERYCAFVDILGFSELIARLSKGDTPFQALRNLLTIIHTPPDAQELDIYQGTDFRAQSISDAVCVSTAPNIAGLCHMLMSLQELAIRLLADGFFVRGAVVKGNLYHDNKMVFGEALVRAFQFEQRVARYPRIVITSEVANDVASALLSSREYSDDLADAIQQADDGPRFLHVLRSMRLELETDDDEMRANSLDLYNLIAGQIQRRYQEALDNPDHFEKVKWFGKYWNRCAGQFVDVERVKGPGVDAEPAYYG
jgi:hypothetical protein